LIDGIILKGFSGFYYVRTQAHGEVECSLRGRFRQERLTFLPGDYVKISLTNERQGVIEELLPRETELLRPPVANVDQAILVLALADPPPDLVLLDRLLVYLEQTPVMPVICFNKRDIAGDSEAEEIIGIYKDIGYDLVLTSVKTKTGFDELKNFLQNHISVFAGPSGVGKSSLLNVLEPGFKLETGSVSDKARRGKHTTRHTKLLSLYGGYVADTPGFSRIELPNVSREELSFLFPEMDGYRQDCRFNTCLHYKEPQCAVKQALERGAISQSRYKNYLRFLEEITARERSY